LPCSDSEEKPGNERSTMKAVMPLWPFERSTVAKTRKWSAVSAREIQILLPLRRYRSPSRRAVVCRALAARLGDQVALLLLLAPPLEQGERVQPRVDRQDDPEGRVGALHLLAQQGEGDVVHARAAVVLRDRQAQEALGAHLLVQGAIVGRGLVELADARQDLALREGARRALHLALRIGQREVDHRFSVRGWAGA